MQSISQLWVSADYDGKRKLQKNIFPEGLLVDMKNRVYLTTKTNTFIELITSFSTNYKLKKEGDFQQFAEKPLSVARTGIEPMTFGL